MIVKNPFKLETETVVLWQLYLIVKFEDDLSLVRRQKADQDKKESWWPG